jgi:hypothetical protein
MMVPTGEFHLYAKEQTIEGASPAPLAVVQAVFFDDSGEPEYVGLLSDPFADQEWGGDELAMLEKMLVPLIESRVDVIKEEILVELNKHAFQPWMTSIKEARCATDSRLTMLSGLIDMVRAALVAGGRVVYLSY